VANGTEHLHAEIPEDRDFPAIEEALAEQVGVSDPLRRAEALRRRLGPALGRQAAELAALRARAAERFPSGWLRWLTRRGLEQSTRESVARERARRILRVAAGCTVFDGTSGLGADARAVSEMGMAVVAADRDTPVARCARANLAGSPAPHVALVADALAPPLRPDAALFLVLDPDRRAEGARELDPERWSPPLSAVLALAGRFRGACIKLSPAFDMAGLGLADPSRLLAQWVSDRGELCEMNLWTGVGAGAEAGLREAVALGPDGSATRLVGVPIPAAAPLSEISSGNCWLLDPDSAVVRSGLVGNLAREHGLHAVDPHLAYLIGSGPVATPLAKGWRILDHVPADARKVRESLTRLGFGPVEVRKRGHSEPAEVLAASFRGRGDRRGLVAVARTEQGHRAFVLEPDRGPSSTTPNLQDPRS
jgi:hypothetical protein